MQNRIGPDRAGPVRPAPDASPTASSCSSRSSRSPTPPTGASSASRRTSSLLPAFLAFSIVPIGGVVTIAGHETFLQLADLPVRHPVAAGDVGARPLRRAARGLVVGIEVPAARLGARVGAAAQLRSRVRRSRSSACWCSRTRSRRAASSSSRAGTASSRSSTATGTGCRRSSRWSIFLIAAVAETNHPPFDLVEAEQELTGGFFTEYTGIKFAIFYLAEFMNLITMCGDRGDALLRRPNGPGARLPRRERLVQRVDHAGVLVHVQGDRAAVRHRLAARIAAAPALRPAHGPRLEVPHRDRLPLGDDLRRRGRRQGGGLVDVDRPARGHRRRPRRRRHPLRVRCPSRRSSSRRSS